MTTEHDRRVLPVDDALARYAPRIAAPSGESLAPSARQPGRVGARRLVSAAGAGVLVSGLVVNVYLAVVARALSPAQYATFGSFWALALVLGFGSFLPLEQELARRLPQPQDRRALLRAASGASAVLAVLSVAVLLAATPVVDRALDGNVSSLLALVALCAVSAGQFLLRGTLIGTDRLVRHGAVMVLDAVVRLGLAGAIFIVGGGRSDAFCWALVVAIALAHLPLLPAAFRRAVDWSAPAEHWRQPAATTRRLTAAIGPLLVASVCAQLLLNGVPVLVVAMASGNTQAAAGVFVAAFNLVRAPLAMVVPLQSAVVPTLTRLIDQGRRHEVGVILLKGVAALSVTAVVGLPLAYWVGPVLIRLVFGHDYVIGGTDLVVMAAAVLAHIALVVVTQVHVARGSRRDVALSWLAALAAAGFVFLAVPGPVLAGELAFLAGSVLGAVVSAGLLAMSGRRGLLVRRGTGRR